MQCSNKYKQTIATYNIDKSHSSMLNKGKPKQRSAHSINLIIWLSTVGKDSHVDRNQSLGNGN